MSNLTDQQRSVDLIESLDQSVSLNASVKQELLELVQNKDRSEEQDERLGKLLDLIQAELLVAYNDVEIQKSLDARSEARLQLLEEGLQEDEKTILKAMQGIMRHERMLEEEDAVNDARTSIQNA